MWLRTRCVGWGRWPSAVLRRWHVEHPSCHLPYTKGLPHVSHGAAVQAERPHHQLQRAAVHGEGLPADACLSMCGNGKDATCTMHGDHISFHTLRSCLVCPAGGGWRQQLSGNPGAATREQACAPLLLFSARCWCVTAALLEVRGVKIQILRCKQRIRRQDRPHSKHKCRPTSKS